MADRPKHLPYEEEAKVLQDIIDFFIDKLPHAIEETAEQIDEAQLSHNLFEQLSQLNDEELAKRGLHREDIAKAAALAASLFRIAHKANSTKN